MNGFSNENIVDRLCGGCECSGFTPKVDLSYVSGTGVLTVTDSSTYPTGDSRKIVHVYARDKNAKKVISSIAAADGDGVITMDLTSLDKSEGFTIESTVVTANGCISDGHFSGLGIVATASSLGGWDKDNNSIS